jgi:MFS family permease
MSSRAMLYMKHYKLVPIVLLCIGAFAIGLLVLDPLMPVWGVAVVMTLVGLGAGASYPTVTVSIQNAVAHHQVGVAMGAMNFFRALASAFVVAVMGAIMLAQLGTAPQRGAAHAVVTVMHDAAESQLALTFSCIFAVALGFLVLGIVALIVMEERPLRATVIVAPSGSETHTQAAE